jgi:hypothetical protein
MSSTRDGADFQAPAAAFPSSGLEPEPVSIVSLVRDVNCVREGVLGIDSESDTAANLVIGPTSLGMVRIYIEAEGIDLPMDFEPEEALEIADELRAAAEKAAAMVAGRHGKPGGKSGDKSGGKAGGKSGSRSGGRHG